MTLRLVDLLPLWGTFASLTLILFTAAEIGFHLGRWREKKFKGEVKGQTGTILGASLGMLAFMLAFTFGMAGTIQSDRKAMVLKEANAVGTAYLRARLLPGPSGTEVQDLLRRYVDVRLQGARFHTPDELQQAVARSEELHEALWDLAVDLSHESPASIPVGLFIASINDVIDLHTKRLTAGVRNRVPTSIMVVLLLVAVLTMTMMGYQAGLTGIRTLIPRFILILAFSSVMLLIVELDRPSKTLMNVSEQAMIDLQAAMNKTGD